MTNGGSPCMQRVKSDPNLNQPQQICSQPVNNQNGFDYMNHDVFDHGVPVQQQQQRPLPPQSHLATEPNWKKFATYSANSLRSLSNGLMVDQNGTFYQKTSNSSTPTKQQQQLQQQTPTKLRPALQLTSSDHVDFMSYPQNHPEMRRFSTDFKHSSSANDGFSSPSDIRNSVSYSSYKMLNSASQNGLIGIPKSNGVDQQQQSQINGGSLLQPINNENLLESKMGDMKINGSNLLFNKQLKQELNAKLNDHNKLKIEQNMEMNTLKNYEDNKYDNFKLIWHDLFARLTKKIL